MKLENLDVLVTPSAESDLSGLPNREEVISLLKEIENSPLLFFSQSSLVDAPNIDYSGFDKSGRWYKLNFNMIKAVFLKTDGDNKLYLVAIL